MVYDLGGDGGAELAVKTAPGTRGGAGEFLSTGPAADDDDSADYRNSAGKIVSGPEYLTIFSGIDGAELAMMEHHAPITSGSFGDNSGNRSDRYNATLAFVDETGRPTAVMQRGYYERTTFGAYNYRCGELLTALGLAATGDNLGDRPAKTNFLVWWDGDESRELLNSNGVANFGGEAPASPPTAAPRSTAASPCRHSAPTLW